jgi:hypothetical protein
MRKTLFLSYHSSRSSESSFTHHFLRLSHWNLEIGVYLEFGVWSLEINS